MNEVESTPQVSQNERSPRPEGGSPGNRPVERLKTKRENRDVPGAGYGISFLRATRKHSPNAFRTHYTRGINRVPGLTAVLASEGLTAVRRAEQEEIPFRRTNWTCSITRLSFQSVYAVPLENFLFIPIFCNLIPITASPVESITSYVRRTVGNAFAPVCEL